MTLTRTIYYNEAKMNTQYTKINKKILLKEINANLKQDPNAKEDGIIDSVEDLVHALA